MCLEACDRSPPAEPLSLMMGDAQNWELGGRGQKDSWRRGHGPPRFSRLGVGYLGGHWCGPAARGSGGWQVSHLQSLKRCRTGEDRASGVGKAWASELGAGLFDDRLWVVRAGLGIQRWPCWGPPHGTWGSVSLGEAGWRGHAESSTALWLSDFLRRSTAL